MTAALTTTARFLTWLRSLPHSRIVTGQTDEMEFLPAAIEIVETPPLPAGRIIAGTIILFFASALLWACLGSVDIIATAPGKIVPTGRTKVIQPLESGVVHAIHVQDGQKVNIEPYVDPDAPPPAQSNQAPAPAQ